MTTCKSIRELTILSEGGRLRARALAGERDPNEAYLMAHRVMARAFGDATRATSPAALDTAMGAEIARGGFACVS